MDDEADILDLLSYNLERAGYTTLRAGDGKTALRIARKEDPELIILDVMMPGLDGIETCRRLREDPLTRDTCILFLTARSEEYSEMAGFDAGADDYIAKPIKPKVLIKRIGAILRRKENSTFGNRPPTLKVNDLEISWEEYLIKRNDKSITLPRKEFELFYFLAAHPGKVFTREDLLQRVWENPFVVDRTVDVHVRQLRKKIGKEYIQTIKGVGYKFLLQDSHQHGAYL